MPSCVLRTCKSHSRRKSDDVKFHKFPACDDERREPWIKFVQNNRKEDTWLPTTSSCICSAHFKDSDKYFSKSGRTYLTKTAIPCYSTTKSGDSEMMEPICEIVSDSESIFDAPQKIMLKAKLSKETAARKKLAIKFKKAQRQIRYLKRKCECYKSMIKDIKRNLDLIVKPEMI